MIYGYCRISTPKQSIERQKLNIKAAYPEAVLIEEVYTGTKEDRPKWSALKKKAAAGDKIVFDEVSRMSRNAAEGFASYEELYRRGVNLIFLKEPMISTDTYKKAMSQSLQLTGTALDKLLEGINAYILELAREQIRLAFNQAEAEAKYNSRRTREGVAAAKLNGKQPGRKTGAQIETKKAAAAKKVIIKHSKRYNGALTDKDCMKLSGVSAHTFYKYIRELNAEPGQLPGQQKFSFD